MRTTLELVENKPHRKGAERKGAMKGGRERAQRVSSILPATKRRVLLLMLLFDMKYDTGMHNLQTTTE